MAATQITASTAMTLAAIAPTGATSRPSGESPQVQTARVRTGVARQLADCTSWELKWLGLSPDNANMAYIAVNLEPDSGQVAVVIRGTDANALDIMEDLTVGTVVPFTAGGSPTPVSVSKGAMAAFTQVVNMLPAVPDPAADGGILLQGLADVLATMAPDPTVYVIGHSLGGCVATMVALYLKAQRWTNPPNIGVLTFAAPTAGLADFAAYFGAQNWAQCERHVNRYDLIPQAWASLDIPIDPLRPWYPDPGPKGTEEVEVLIRAVKGFPGYNTYVQPSPITEWNHDYQTVDRGLIKHSTEDFMGQVGYQHANTTYLSLLGATVPLTPTPVVTSVSPTFGAAQSQVTITGSGFSAFTEDDTAVDFGPIACGGNAFEIKSDNQIVVHNVPWGFGIVDVCVTNPLGTSPAVPLAQFAYGGPEPVVVTAIAPTSAATGQQVTVTGTGFGAHAMVYFGEKPSPLVTLGSDDPPQLVATIPDSGKRPGKVVGTVVGVTVAVNGYSSPTTPLDEFTYTG
ncbi:lipase class 3 [Catenulispora acidiphila DSM 44928]|uniref:Lipase class 3 n=1 Tax=Catenulispora acidiphila (strain DSM 44928 / JCM 14897 / NBRC 102108 / NRRL B-24433 / ID139908) TaxID=479433 RepID=C7QDI6_CATAD|nr:alpha/beta fold hydrolase [Catenulispora acidiphila]ACU74610.1 lipase class 3 [Catenulispora acidiphila DSM 44928]